MIRFAIAGTGRISDWALKGALEDPRFIVTAVCSRSGESALDFIASHRGICSGDVKVFTDIGECARCPEVDAVYIGTPSSTHCHYAITCMEAGKSVLCEKPMACSEKQMREMILCARRNGVLLMEAMVSTLSPCFRAAADAIGSLGPIHHCFTSYCQYSTKYDALLQGSVSNSFDPAMGGGALEDIGIYTIYPLVALFGEPDNIQGSLQRIHTPKGNVDIGGSAILHFGGMTSSLNWSKAVDAHLCSEICGEKGNVILDDIHICRHASFIPHGKPSAGRSPGQTAVTLAKGLDHDIYFYEFKEFMDILESGRTESTVNSLEISLRCRRVMDTLHRLA